MTTIYGLREKGSDEVRYVGQTNGPLDVRLHKHRLNVRQNYPRKISAWLQDAGEVEIVPLAECPTETACAEERRMVERLHQEGHRLTNGHLLPRAA